MKSLIEVMRSFINLFFPPEENDTPMSNKKVIGVFLGLLLFIVFIGIISFLL